MKKVSPKRPKKRVRIRRGKLQILREKNRINKSIIPRGWIAVTSPMPAGFTMPEKPWTVKIRTFSHNFEITVKEDTSLEDFKLAVAKGALDKLLANVTLREARLVPIGDSDYWKELLEECRKLGIAADVMLS